MSQGREEVKEATKEILEIMRRSASNHGSTSEGEPHEMIDQINKSMRLIGPYQSKLKNLYAGRRGQSRVIQHSKLFLKLSRRIKSILKSIKAQRSMIAMLESMIVMENQRKKLESITKSTGETDDEVSESGVDDNSSKDNDEEAVGGKRSF